VGLLVMQVGAALMPALSPRDAMLAIGLGSMLGAGLLAWVGSLGARHGLSSSALIGSALGRSFALLPVGLNVLQLLGWTAFELVIMRDGSAALLQRVGLGGAWAAPVLTLLWGALLMALAAGSMVGLVRRFVSRFGLPLVVLSLAWLSWQFGSRLAEQGLTAWWSRPGTGEMSALQALDLVIAMPVSWLPLVADYARYGRSARHAVGHLAGLHRRQPVVLRAGRGGGVHGAGRRRPAGHHAAGAGRSDRAGLHPDRRGRQRLWRRALGRGVGALPDALALEHSPPGHRPGGIGHGRRAGAAHPQPGAFPAAAQLRLRAAVRRGAVAAGGRRPAGGRAVRAGPALLWLAGIACFHLGSAYWPQWGSALPCLAFTLIGGWLLRLLPQGPRPTPSAPSP
jgi:NCS1 family nucleobase:cation symporter-1